MRVEFWFANLLKYQNLGEVPLQNRTTMIVQHRPTGLSLWSILLKRKRKQLKNEGSGEKKESERKSEMSERNYFQK